LIGVAAAVGNAVRDASGVRVRSVPVLPEKVWAGLKER
jgi:CO/xanthine dehydrogenase Mo-binding subunit